MLSRITLSMCHGGELVENGESGLVAQLSGEDAVAVGGLPSGVRSALLRLNGDGIAEDELLSLGAETDGVVALPMMYFALERLAASSLLRWCATGERGPLATAAGARSFLDLRKRALDAETRYVLSRFALARRVGTQMVLETSLSSIHIVIHDSRVMALVAGDLAVAPSGLSEEEISVVGTLLLQFGILAEAKGEGEAVGEDEGSLMHWEFHDLLLHARSRVGRHRGGYGGTYRLRGRVEPLPALKPAMSDDAIELYRPDLERLRCEDTPFTAVLESRKSMRTFGDPPIHLRQVGELLYRAARQRRTFDDPGGQQVGSRPYPSGGALYELEIYASVAACTELPPGLYHYAPGEHRLFRLATRSNFVDRLVQRAAQLSHGRPQVLLTFAARFGRIFWKYEAMGYAAILKHVGVLFQTMYLVAEAMGLGACALGGGDSDLLAEAAGLDYYAESAVGEFLIGSRGDG